MDDEPFFPTTGALYHTDSNRICSPMSFSPAHMRRYLRYTMNFIHADSANDSSSPEASSVLEPLVSF